MKIFTQKEMLEEGFWDFTKSVGRVGKVLGKAAVNTVAPELYNQVKSDYEGFQNFKGNLSKAANPYKFIENSLKSQGYVLVPPVNFQPLPPVAGDPKKKFKVNIQTDPNYLPQGQANPITPVIVDDGGNIIRDLSKSPQVKKGQSTQTSTQTTTSQNSPRQTRTSVRTTRRP